MRKAFVSALVELAERDERIVLLTGDLGFSVIEPFAERFPERFFNVGVAEQNMIGVATGLAEAGLLPFAYSIVTFATARPYEFIRNGPVQHNLPVRIAGVGGGVEYGINGYSHHGLEDIALMRTLPGMTIVAPVDHRQARSAVLATATQLGPVYYRLGKDDSRVAAGHDGSFETGRLDVLADGDDVAIIAVGPIVDEAVRAAEALAESGIYASVAAVTTINPSPIAGLESLLARVPLAVTVEAHRPAGGVGSLVAETAADSGSACRVVRLGIEAGETFGSERHLLEHNGLSGEQIAARVAGELGGVLTARNAADADV